MARGSTRNNPSWDEPVVPRNSHSNPNADATLSGPLQYPKQPQWGRALYRALRPHDGAIRTRWPWAAGPVSARAQTDKMPTCLVRENIGASSEKV